MCPRSHLCPPNCQDLNKDDADVDTLSLAYADEDRQYNGDGSVAKMSLQIMVGTLDDFAAGRFRSVPDTCTVCTQWCLDLAPRDSVSHAHIALPPSSMPSFSSPPHWCRSPLPFQVFYAPSCQSAVRDLKSGMLKYSLDVASGRSSMRLFVSSTGA
jgi:hypothetical protein